MLEWLGMRSWFFRALLALALLSCLPWKAAQAEAPGTAVASITAVDANNFPRMFTYVSVTGADGIPVSGLDESAFALTENGEAASATAVRAVTLGVQTVFAFDVGAAFKTRDVLGNSRLDYLRLAVNDFAQAEGGLQPDLDDISLITPEQELLIHANTRGPVVDALDRYTTDFAGVADHVALLTRAIDIASDATTRPGMRRVVVFASTGLSDNNQPVAVDTLIQRAQSAGIKLITIYVGPDGTQEGPNAQALRTLADETGGIHAFLAGNDSLGPVFSTLAAERGQYQIEYRSMLNETGQHRLNVSVELASGQSVRAREAVFQLRIEPPAVALETLAPSFSASSVKDTLDVPYTLNFADGHSRDLQTVELIVDGAVAARATSGAESITWPMTSVTDSLTRTVQVRVVDELGLEGISQPASIFVEAPPPVVEAPPTSATMTLHATPYALWAGLLSLVALAAIGAYAWHQQGWKIPTVKWPSLPRKTEGDPSPAGGAVARVEASSRSAPPTPAGGAPAVAVDTTQPMRPTRAAAASRLKIPSLPRPTIPDLGSLHRPQMPRVNVAHLALPKRITQPLADALAAAQRGNVANSHAVLEVVDHQVPQRARIELNGISLRFGRDPELAEVTFNDRSVSRLHARIEAVAENVYRIYDEGSTSGTWVNYSQVTSPDGQELSTGDVINLGRVKLKFKKPRKAKAA